MKRKTHHSLSLFGFFSKHFKLLNCKATSLLSVLFCLTLPVLKNSFGEVSWKIIASQKITSSFTGGLNTLCAHGSFIFNVPDAAIWTWLTGKQLIRSSCSLTKALYKPLGALLLNLELSLPPPAHSDSVLVRSPCLQMLVKVNPWWIIYFWRKLCHLFCALLTLMFYILYRQS